MTETHEQRVERLARALLADQGDVGKGKPVAPWERQPEAFRQRMLRNARAIIASDREAGLVTVPRKPTEAMRHAGGMVLDPGARMEGPNSASRQKAARVYEAAIAAHEQEERQDAP